MFDQAFIILYCFYTVAGTFLGLAQCCALVVVTVEFDLWSCFYEDDDEEAVAPKEDSFVVAMMASSKGVSLGKKWSPLKPLPVTLLRRRLRDTRRSSG